MSIRGSNSDRRCPFVTRAAGTCFALSWPDRVPRSTRPVVPTHPAGFYRFQRFGGFGGFGGFSENLQSLPNLQNLQNTLGGSHNEALEQRRLGFARSAGALGGSRLRSRRRGKL